MAQPFPIAMFTQPHIDPTFATQWTGSDSDGDYFNTNNWTNGLPTQYANVTLSGSNSCDNAPSRVSCKSWNATGFSGYFSNNGGYDLALKAYGNINLGSMSNGGIIICGFAESGILTTNGFFLITIDDQRDYAHAVTVTLADDPIVQFIDGGGLTININSRTLYLNYDSGYGVSGGIFIAASMLWTSGKIQIGVNGAETRTFGAGVTMAPIYIPVGSSGISIPHIGGLKVQSIDCNAGSVQDQGNPLLTTLEIVDSLTLDDASISGLNFAITVHGATCNARNTYVGNCDFSGGTALTALIADGCTDGGGNTNVIFV